MAGKENGARVLQILNSWSWVFGLWSLKREGLQFNHEDREGTKTKSQRPKTKSADLRFKITDFRACSEEQSHIFVRSAAQLIRWGRNTVSVVARA